MSDVLVLTGDRDSPGKHDYSRGFKPWAEAFAKLHSAGEVVRIPCGKTRQKTRALLVREAILARPRITAVALFCHGLSNRIQLGLSLRAVDDTYGPADLAGWIAERSTWGNVVTTILYACSTGKNGDGGFADELRDGLCGEGDTYCRVDAHTTAGRADANPFVSRFDGLGSPVGGTGGQWLVAPGSKLWPKWCTALKSTDLWARFPFMSVEEIHAEVLG